MSSGQPYCKSHTHVYNILIFCMKDDSPLNLLVQCVQFLACARWLFTKSNLYVWFHSIWYLKSCTSMDQSECWDPFKDIFLLQLKELVDTEEQCRRSLWEQLDFRWNSDLRASDDVEISVHSSQWVARPGLHINTWFPDSRKLVRVSHHRLRRGESRSNFFHFRGVFGKNLAN